jgi:hypothetical protein
MARVKHYFWMIVAWVHPTLRRRRPRYLHPARGDVIDLEESCIRAFGDVFVG